MPSFCWACRAMRRSRSSRVSEVQAVPQKMRVALVLAVMGSKSWSNLAMLTDWASSTERSRSAVAPRTLARGSPEKNCKLGLAKLVGVALGGFPQAARADAGVEGGFDTIHVNLGLGLEGGGDGDDAPAGMGIAEQQPGEEVGLEFVLAGLARQDDDEGEAEVVDDGFFDGAGDLDLVGAQVDAAGIGPGDGAAADGGADAFSGCEHI